MYIPTATYRVQMSQAFPFKALEEIIPYLGSLGVDTIYLSPVFQARPGSTHGYDVTDPLKINEEIGSRDECGVIGKMLKAHGMGWLQDIVPNHMAFDNGNAWLMNVLERGPQSFFRQFFDINWEHPLPQYAGRLMVPFLGESLHEAIRKETITLHFGQKGFYFQYYESHYPVSSPAYGQLLKQGMNFMERTFSPRDKALGYYMHLYEEFRTIWDDESIWEKLKKRLIESYRENSLIHDAIHYSLDVYNTSPDLMARLLDQQYFTLDFWRTTEKQINYRRFFTINDLICLRMEEEKVFDHYHTFIAELCREGLVQGLRVDHIDGLFDPEGYLKNLRRLAGKSIYIVIEKILEWEESLPSHWPVQGTSGYSFLALVNNLFTDATKEAAFSRFYEDIAPQLPDYEALIYEKKYFILTGRMGGELDNLYELLKRLKLISEEPSRSEKWLEALGAFLAAFPVYRIYPSGAPLNEYQQEVLARAFRKAKEKAAGSQTELDLLYRIFLGEANQEKENMDYFLKRCQQFTGPLAAKGVEDTSFYIFNRLISHNEVGDTPDVFGISTEYFHHRILERLKNFPHPINATATHDTKRGEDARMRINVLSELPEEWFGKVKEWQQINAGSKKKDIPSANEEYFIYQVLIGHSPFDGNLDSEFLSRTIQYLQKMLREAKMHSGWAEPDEKYEQQVFDFIASVAKNSLFLDSFIPFMRRVGFHGMLNSLSQTLIKVTAPGVPDIYQGSELWDFSYVDPDNRRPVDFKERAAFLREMNTQDKGEAQKLTRALLENYTDGKIKLYTLHKALMERKKHKSVFEEGSYLPLEIFGKRRGHAICYGRQHKKDFFLTIAPLMTTSLGEPGEFPLNEATWEDTYIEIPEAGPYKWINTFTDEKISVSGRLYLHEALAHFPVALLWGES